MRKKMQFVLRPKHIEYIRAMAVIRKIGISDVLMDIIEEYRQRHEIGADKGDIVK